MKIKKYEIKFYDREEEYSIYCEGIETYMDIVSFYIYLNDSTHISKRQIIAQINLIKATYKQIPEDPTHTSYKRTERLIKRLKESYYSNTPDEKCCEGDCSCKDEDDN